MRQIGLYFEWHYFALIYDKQAPYESVAVALRELAVDKNYTIKSTHYISSDTKDDHVVAMLQQIKKFARGICDYFPLLCLMDYTILISWSNLIPFKGMCSVFFLMSLYLQRKAFRADGEYPDNIWHFEGF